MGLHAFKHKFTMAGEKVFVNSVDAGVKYNFSNVLANPVHSWDANKNHLDTRYDKLQRPIEVWVTPDGFPKFLAQKTIYGEDKDNPTESNHCLQAYKVYDGAGLVTSKEYDFKGNLKSASRVLLKDPKAQVQWANESMSFTDILADSKLENKPYESSSTYDALNRVLTAKNPDRSDQTFTYNKRSLIYSIKLKQKDKENLWEENLIVEKSFYNAKGQKEKMVYGNKVRSKFEYETDTFRLQRIYSYRNNNVEDKLQDIKYTYDPVGNISYKTDDAICKVFHCNQIITPDSHYVYDFLYRLIIATGREHISNTRYDDCRQTPGFIQLTPPVTDATSLQMYSEHYEYDKSGNFKRTAHYDHILENLEIPESPNTVWNTYRQYENDSNRIISCRNENGRIIPEDQRDFPHDANGNIIKMPHLPKLTWNFANQLVEVELNVAEENPDKAYYQYDTSGMRVRKLVQKNGKTEERIYLGGFEIYKEQNATENLQRNTIQIKSGESLIAMVEQDAEFDNIILLIIPAPVINLRTIWALPPLNWMIVRMPIF
jgi:YD repeat-containing protein